MHDVLFYWVNNTAERWQLLDAVGIFCAQTLIFIMSIVALLLALYWWRTRRDGRLLGGGIAGVALTELCVPFLKHIIGEKRPFMILPDVHVLITPPVSNAFPSGHAALAFALAMSVWLVHRQWGRVFFVAAVLVSLGRIFVGVHWPGDVAVGALVGTALAYLGSLLIRRSTKKNPDLDI